MSTNQDTPIEETPVAAEPALEETVVTGEIVEDDIAEDTLTAEAAPQASIEDLQKALLESQQTAQENWDKALRIQAEMENLKRRTQKDLDDARKYALTSFSKELLPVLDSLVLGLQAATGDGEDVQKFREGSELTLRQLETAFSKFNITEINPVGEVFNAEQHQAMVMQAVEGAEPNTVVNVFQKGYLLNGRLLRPALVVVAKAAD